MCNSKFLELSGTLLSSVLLLQIRGEKNMEKKGDKHRNPSPKQEEPANHDGTEALSWGKREERRREKKGDPGGTRRSQQIMREQRPFLARIENPIQLKSCLGKNSSKQIIETANCHPVDAVDAVATSPRSRWNWGSSEVPNGHQMSHPSHQTTGIWPLCWWLEEKLHEIEAQNCVNCLVFHYDFKKIYIYYIIYIYIYIKRWRWNPNLFGGPDHQVFEAVPRCFLPLCSGDLCILSYAVEI